jgi:gas vesicle protein
MDVKINDNGKCLLQIDDHTKEHYEQAKEWHTELGNDIRIVDKNLSTHYRAAKRWHRDTNENIHQVGIDILEHSRDWRSETKQKNEG